jgi:hypothetical protein
MDENVYNRIFVVCYNLPMTNSPEINDPLSHLPTAPLREKAGYYVDGGFSPYTVESLQQVKEYLADRQPGEPLLNYIERQNNENPGALTHLTTDGIPTIHEDDRVVHAPRQQRLVHIGRRTLNALFNHRLEK